MPPGDALQATSLCLGTAEHWGGWGRSAGVAARRCVRVVTADRPQCSSNCWPRTARAIDRVPGPRVGRRSLRPEGAWVAAPAGHGIGLPPLPPNSLVLNGTEAAAAIGSLRIACACVIDSVLHAAVHSQQARPAGGTACESEWLPIPCASACLAVRPPARFGASFTCLTDRGVSR
jgi:hypothetical protein